MTLRACIVGLVIDPGAGDCLAAPGFHAHARHQLRVVALRVSIPIAGDE